MGKTFVKVKMWNILDEKSVKKGDVKPLDVEAQVDNGATTTIITPEIVKKLNLEPSYKTKVKYADERVSEREIVIGLRLEIMGRDTICRAIIEPKRKLSLIGQLVLEDTDLWIDSKNGRLVPNPESPDEPLLEIL